MIRRTPPSPAKGVGSVKKGTYLSQTDARCHISNLIMGKEERGGNSPQIHIQIYKFLV